MGESWESCDAHITDSGIRIPFVIHIFVMFVFLGFLFLSIFEVKTNKQKHKSLWGWVPYLGFTHYG